MKGLGSSAIRESRNMFFNKRISADEVRIKEAVLVAEQAVRQPNKGLEGVS